MIIYVVHEIEGGSILEAFDCLEDAKSFLQWEHVSGKNDERYYTITAIKLNLGKK